MEDFNSKIAHLVQTDALSSGHFVECLEHQSDLGIGHKDLAHQTCAVVFNHHCDWSLVQSHVDRLNR
jgi:hypothetical protein